MNKDILPFWQEIGTSTSIIAKKVSEKLHTPTSHTGTLDPLASGVVLIIKGEEYFNKEKYIQKNKTYEFEILFGFSTDTHDAMGLITGLAEKTYKFDSNKLKEIVYGFKGNYKQQYPDFSSKKINGKTLWQYKREGLEVPEAYIEGEISEIEILDFKEVNSFDEIQNIKSQIKKVEGNFRQGEILSQYDATEFPLVLSKVKIRVVMSRGLYVRGLVRDIVKKLDTFGITLNLIRTKDGEYTKDDCYLIPEYFSNEIKENPNFLSPYFKI